MKIFEDSPAVLTIALSERNVRELVQMMDAPHHSDARPMLRKLLPSGRYLQVVVEDDDDHYRL